MLDVQGGLTAKIIWTITSVEFMGMPFEEPLPFSRCMRLNNTQHLDNEALQSRLYTYASYMFLI